jgi:hypothetical protein
MKNIKKQLTELAIEAANQTKNLIIVNKEVDEAGQVLLRLSSDTSKFEKTIQSVLDLINSLPDGHSELVFYFVHEFRALTDFLNSTKPSVRAYITDADLSSDEAKKQFLNNL